MKTYFCSFAIALLAINVSSAAETAPAPRVGVDLTGYRNVPDAIKADPKSLKMNAAPAIPGFLGIEIGTDATGRARIEDVQSESPAEKAGLKTGDTILAIGDDATLTVTAAREKLRMRFAGEELAIRVQRGKETIEIRAKWKAASVPYKLTGDRAVLGIQMTPPKLGGGVEITSVTTGGGADKAGVKIGDVITKVDATSIEGDNAFRELFTEKKAGDIVTLSVKRGKDTLEIRATLANEDRTARTGGWDDRLPRIWTKPAFRLAIIGVEYPDVKHNPKIGETDWDAAMFSTGGYADKNATGQRTYGSMNDYYREISYGKFNISGQFAGWVEVSKKRHEYSTGNGTSSREKSSLLTEAMDKLLAAKGKDALKDYDGVFFLYAGERVQTTRGSLYWPHRASVRHNGKSWPYFIVSEMVPQRGTSNMTDISVFCHEFGHMIGLPDLYAKPEVPGMEGVGAWCAMSQQNPAGRPQHFSAWCKEQLGWIQPTLIDPRIKQKIILRPIEDAPTDCLKIVVRPDASEYFLLENRKKKGFDANLPAEGLLIWRVMPGRGSQPVYLEESHGIAGPEGPRAFSGAVPFPSPANNAFTPQTIPSSASQIGGGLDVHITNIRRLSDGRIVLHIGYQYQ